MEVLGVGIDIEDLNIGPYQCIGKQLKSFAWK
jgi:hypothetical protein